MMMRLQLLTVFYAGNLGNLELLKKMISVYSFRMLFAAKLAFIWLCGFMSGHSYKLLPAAFLVS